MILLATHSKTLLAHRSTSLSNSWAWSASSWRASLLPAYNNTLGVVFVRIRLYIHGKKCLYSPKKTFLFVKVIRCVQAVRHQTLRLNLLIRFILRLRKSADKDLKNHYISSKKTSINNGKNTCKKQVCNHKEIN